MKEAHPELSDKAIAHLHYFGGLNDTDVEYEAHRLALRDKHGAAGLHLLYESSTRLSANARKLEELPAEIRDIPEADDADTDAEEYQGAFKAIGDVAGAVANDVRKLAPTQGNDLIEGVGLGVEQAEMSLDKLGEKLVTSLPEPLKDDRSEGFFKLTPQSPEELAWLNANAQPDPGEPHAEERRQSGDRPDVVAQVDLPVGIGTTLDGAVAPPQVTVVGQVGAELGAERRALELEPLLALLVEQARGTPVLAQHFG